MSWSGLLALFARLVLWVPVAQGFEIFAEQQILTLNDPNRSVFFNNTELGSTHIDDYWNKLDINYSPLDGYSLFRHVRLGCFRVRWEAIRSQFYSQTTSPDITEIDCVTYCNRSQAFWQYPFCRCAIVEEQIPLEEVQTPSCPMDAWEIFREYDYRSSMSPSTYDVPRRLVYQIVTVRIPHVTPSVRYYLHAVNAFEAKPKFQFDTRLDRMIFNAVWDFGSSRMVSLSFRNWGAPLDFTILSFNTSTGPLVVSQNHYPIENQISSVGALLGAGLASADGMGTVDILFGTYYTVVPAVISDTPQDTAACQWLYNNAYLGRSNEEVRRRMESQYDRCKIVHVIVAVEIDRKRVITSITLPLQLMNIQINALQHILYGAATDMNGNYAYYEVCRTRDYNVSVDGRPVLRFDVQCALSELGRLPQNVNHVYLQSAAIDHRYNYAWFTYKQVPTGRPRILEYHHNSAEYEIWREESLPLESAYTALIQTAPRIIFSLYPPVIQSARFASSGTKIFVVFDAPTLRGAIPIDSNGDEVPDYWRNEDKKVGRKSCENFLDDFTMKLIPQAMCQWTSDTTFYIEVSPQATIMPGDMIRIRPNTVYAGRISPSGVALFSQPTTSFAFVQVPEVIPIPVAIVSGLAYMDECTQLLLDGSASKDHGFRGKFRWYLNRTKPDTSVPHVAQIDNILTSQQPDGQSQQMVTIPAYILQGDHTYFFSLEVTSFFDPQLSTIATKKIVVSSDPVPPLQIFGPPSRQVAVDSTVHLVGTLEFKGCETSLERPKVKYNWTVCLESTAVPLLGGMIGCPSWDQELSNLTATPAITGIMSRSLHIRPNSLRPAITYMVTLTSSVNASGMNIMENQASIRLFVTPGQLSMSFVGGTRFVSRSQEPLVLDLSPSYDPADPGPAGGSGAQFVFACTSLATNGPCFQVGRRLSDPSGPPYLLPNIPCVDNINPQTGQPRMFQFRGTWYSAAQGITYGPRSQDQKYCMQGQSVLIIQSRSLQPGLYRFDVNMTKDTNGFIRRRNASVEIELVTAPERMPVVSITMESREPFVVGQVLRFVGSVTNGRNNTQYKYQWNASQFGANPLYDHDVATTDPTYTIKQYTYIPVDNTDVDFSNPNDIRTPVGSRYLVTVPNKLNPGIEYKFRLSVTDTVLEAQGDRYATGWAEVTFRTVGLPPSGGRLEASNITGIAFQTLFQLSLTGWGAEDMPLAYQFGYNLNYLDPYGEVVYLNSMYSDRHTLDTFFPAGQAMPSYTVQVTGFVRSALGIIASTNLDLSVRPPPQGAITSAFHKVEDEDPETALITGSMLTQALPANSPQLPSLLNLVDSRAKITNLGANLPMTTEIMAESSNFLYMLANKGLQTQQVVDQFKGVVDVAIREKRLKVGAALSQEVDLAGTLLKCLDALLPGQSPPPPTLDTRGLSALNQFSADSRLLQQAQDVRSPAEQISALQQLKAVEHRIGTTIMMQLLVGEVPASYALRGHDLHVGKDQVTTGNARLEGTTKRHHPVLESFSVPTLAEPGAPQAYSYQFTQYKKFPYTFMSLPPNRSLNAPVDLVPPGGRRTPVESYNSSQRMWTAMSLELGNLTGGSIEDYLTTSLENATFSVLPRLAANHLQENVTISHAATCYFINATGNLSEAYYESKGLTFSDDSCVTTHLSDFVVFLDRLATQLEEFQSFGEELLEGYVDEYKTMSMVSSLVFTALVALFAAGAAFYLDETQSESNNLPIDMIKKRVIDLPDPKEKLIGTMTFTFKRNHLIVGLSQRHRKLTREKRVWALLIAWLATEAVTTLFHTKLRFRAESQFIATGLVAGVLVFPLVQFVQFLYEWRPETKVSSKPPPTSNKPRPIPLKQQLQAPIIVQPKRPHIPHSVMPPPSTAKPRTGAVPQLALPVVPSGLTLDLPALQLGDRAQKIQPPPPKQGLEPRPPVAPPPKQHMLAARPASIDAAPEGTRFGSATRPMGLVGPGAPFGLTLPELPPLPVGSIRPEGRIPAPPPKPPGIGPKPPQAPPPLTKTFFTVPRNAHLNMPPVPTLKASGLTGPSLPPLPKLMRPFEGFSMVKAAGRDLVPPPPPPKPPAKPGPPFAPLAPETPPQSPRTGVRLSTPPLLPGSTESPRMTGGSSSSTAPAPPRDSEAGRAPKAKFQPEQDHAMAPPRIGGAPQSSVQRTGMPQLPTLPGMPPSQGPRAAASSAGTLLPVPPPPPAPPQGFGGTSTLAPPPFAPPGHCGGMGTMPPMRLGAQGRLPQLPKNLPLQLPPALLTKLPSVQQHPSGLAPPPPPPPRPDDPMRRSELPPPPEAGEGTRKLVEFRGGESGGLGQVQPRPPPKRPQGTFQPTPPQGPPPAHAIVLAKRGGVTGIDEEAIVKRAKPPAVPPKPPQEMLPAFVRKSLQNTATPDGALGLPPGFPRATFKIQSPEEKDPHPVPDWIVWTSQRLVEVFVGGTIAASTFVIFVFGTYLEPKQVWATHAATAVGCVVNVGLFESLKCIVVACVALVKDETLKRQAEIAARKARMALKAQRLQDRTRHRRQVDPGPESLPPPPFMG